MSSKHKNLNLPIEKTDFGYIQKNHYHHPDLYDEAMTELSSPFASLVATGTKMFTFLLLGDQNAGKSTFLHSFTARKDNNWYDLAREIPILSSNFINTRFIENTAIAPLDELPFLDTDIARATILLLREDFEYFLQEHKIPKEQLTADIRYIIIQFIEIGGDHLDLMMSQPKNSSRLLDIVTQSINLLKSSLKTIYFINATTLCSPCDTIDQNQFSLLLHRFNYLNELFPTTHEILCYLTRSEEIQYNQRVFTEKVKSFYPNTHENFDKDVQLDTLPRFLYYCLNVSGKLSNWKINCIDVYLTFHLNADGTLNMAEIIKTLVRCFSKQMVARASDIESYILYYLLDYHKKVILDSNYSLGPVWISQDVFSHFLETIEIHDIPETLLLQKFPIVLQKLANNGFGVLRLTKDKTFFNMTFKSHSGEIIGKWSEHVQLTHVVPIEFRFPLFKPMIGLIKDFFNRELPVDFWLTEVKLKWTKNLLFDFKNILNDLTSKIVEQWQKLPNSNISESKAWNELCLQLEDWIIGRILAGDAHAETIDFEFPTKIHITTKIIEQITKENFILKAEIPADIKTKNILFIIEN